MINDIKQSIVNTLLNIYPGVTIYDEDIPQNFKTPCFLISLTNYSYNKRIDNKFNGEVSFDISFFSSEEKTDIKNDCIRVQQDLFRNFDLIGTYRPISKNATIVDNVLHFVFNIKYSEIKNEEIYKIQNIRTIIRGDN